MHFAIAKCPIKFVKYFTSGLTSVQDKNPSFTNNNPDKNARVVVAKPCTILQEVEIVANGRFVYDFVFKIADSIIIIPICTSQMVLTPYNKRVHFGNCSL